MSRTGLAAVTGASGHIGVNLLAALVAEGRPVRAVSRRTPADRPHGVEWLQADVRDAAATAAALAGCETVFHLAAQISIAGDPDGSVWATNVDGTRNVAEAARAAGARLVHCSSVNAFDFERLGRGERRANVRRLAKGMVRVRVEGPGGAAELDETAPPAVRPELPVYDRSKAAGDAEVRAAVERGLDAVIVYPTAVVGAVDPEPSRMGRVLLAAARRRLPAVVSGGLDWVDVRDVCEGMLAAERAGRRGEGYLLGGEWASIGRIARLAAAANGVQPPGIVVPVRVAAALAPLAARVTGAAVRQGFTPEALHTVRFAPGVSHEKAASQLGYQPRPLDESMGDLVDWFVADGRLRRRGGPLKRRA